MTKSINYCGCSSLTGQEIQLTEEQAELFRRIQSDLRIGYDNLNRNYKEFQNMNVVNYSARLRERMDGYIIPRPDQPAWMSNTVRPLTRIKTLSLASHALENYIIPSYYAYNDEEVVDMEPSEIAEMLVEGEISSSYSNYLRKYHHAIIKALDSPLAIVRVDYVADYSNYRKGGLKLTTIRVEDLLIPNPYANIQSQRFIATKEVVDYATLKEEYKDEPNFSFVVEDSHLLMDSTGCGASYARNYNGLKGLCLVEKYYNYITNEYVTLISGVPVKFKTLKGLRSDGLYPFATLGYQPFSDSELIYHKSLVDIMSSSQDVIDTSYNLMINGLTLETHSPKQIIGEEIEGLTEQFARKMSTPMEVIVTPNEIRDINTVKGSTRLADIMSIEERTMGEASISGLGAGQSQQYVTALNSSLAEKNRQIILGLFGAEIEFFVKDLGLLILNSILDNIKIERSGLYAGKYKNRFIPTTNTELQFSLDTRNELEQSIQLAALEEEKNRTIKIVNPELFRQMRFETYIGTKKYDKNKKAVDEILNLNKYDRLVASPYVVNNPDILKKVTEEFLFNTFDFELPETQYNPADVQAPVINNQSLGSLAGQGSLKEALQ